MKRIFKAGQVPSEPGDAERMAEILRTRRCPASAGTDTAFMEGYLTGHDDGLVGESAQPIREQYRKATGGYPAGKRYMSQLARYPGDPRAWVDSKADVKRICEEDNLNWVYSGKLIHEARPPETDPDDKPYEVAPDLINKRLAKAVELEPDLKHNPKKLAEKRYEIAKKAAGRMARK